MSAPSVVSARDIPSLLSEGKYVVALGQGKGTYYVTSDHLDKPYVDLVQKDGVTIPICTDKIPAWYQEIPWDLLSQMRVIHVDSLYIFLDYALDSPSGKAVFIPQLNCVMVTPRARL